MADNKKPALVGYEVLRAREIGDVFREVGEVIEMLPNQAKYYLPPYADDLKLAGGKAAKKAKPGANGDADLTVS